MLSSQDEACKLEFRLEKIPYHSVRRKHNIHEREKRPIDLHTHRITYVLKGYCRIGLLWPRARWRHFQGLFTWR